MDDAVSIIIVTYQPGEELIACLTSIRDQIGCTHEVILSDNSAEEPAVFAQVRSAFPNVKILRNQRNGGFSYGNNIGARSARYPYLLFLNPDTEITAPIDGVARHVPEGCGLISAICFDESGRYKKTAGRFPVQAAMLLKFSNRLERAGAFADGSFHSRFTRVDYTEGSFYLVRKTVFDAVGGFDESLFLYGEDYELAYRVQQAGHANMMARDLRYVHAGGFDDRREPLIVNGLLYFAGKHLDTLQAWRNRAMLMARYAILLAAHVGLGIASARRRSRVAPLFSAFARTWAP